MKLGLTMSSTHEFGWQAQREIARAADRTGLDTLWFAEAYGYDAISQCAAIADGTEHIGLATGVVSVFGRTPATLAQTAATLDMLSGGRFSLGLGTSSSVLAKDWHGVQFEPAGMRLREAIAIIRMILARERLVFGGDCFNLGAGIRLTERPVRPAIPIYLGALTPAGLRLTGEVADGWIAAFFSPAHFATVFQPALDEGKKLRDSALGLLKICVYQPVVVTDDVRAGRDAARSRLARYVGMMGAPEHNYYAKLFTRYGFGAEVTQIQQLYQERRREEGEAAFSDAMVDLVTCIGTPEQCMERLAELNDLGIDEVAMDLSVPEVDAGGFTAMLERLVRMNAA